MSSSSYLSGLYAYGSSLVGQFRSTASSAPAAAATSSPKMNVGFYQETEIAPSISGLFAGYVFTLLSPYLEQGDYEPIIGHLTTALKTHYQIETKDPLFKALTKPFISESACVFSLLDKESLLTLSALSSLLADLLQADQKVQCYAEVLRRTGLAYKQVASLPERAMQQFVIHHHYVITEKMWKNTIRDLYAAAPSQVDSKTYAEETLEMLKEAIERVSPVFKVEVQQILESVIEEKSLKE